MTEMFDFELLKGGEGVMTTAKLHKILDDASKKITSKELCQIIYELKQDTWGEYYKESDKKDANNYKLAFYDGETNAFQIVLDLLDHLDCTPQKGTNND